MLNSIIHHQRIWTISKCNWLLILWIGIAIIGGSFAFPLFFIARTNVLIGFCLLPLVLFINGNTRFNYFYFISMICFGVIAYGYHVRMFYFYALAFYILFVIEVSIGKTSLLVLFLLVFMSPFFHQVATILGFSFRLQLREPLITPILKKIFFIF